MKKITIGTIALLIVAVVIIGLFIMNQPKVDTALGLPINEITEVKLEIDAGDGVTNIVKTPNLASSTTQVDFTYKGQDASISVDYTGYNDCRAGVFGTSTVAFCKNFLRNQINDNIRWQKQSLDAQTEVKTDYTSEIESKDF